MGLFASAASSCDKGHDNARFREHDTDPAAPIDMLEAYYAAHGWEHERHDDEIVATVKGSWTTYELRALWREDDSVLQFLAFPRHQGDRRSAWRRL